MPLYSLYCPRCEIELERFCSVETMYTQECEECGAVLEKRFSVPTLRTDTQFMAGAGVACDGLHDPMSRRMAYAKAKAAGVNIAGKKFHPGLCRRGVPFDPQAWYGDRSEVVRKADAMGRCVEGDINHTSAVRDEDYARVEAPYRCSAQAVRDEVNAEIRQAHGGKVSRKKRREITERLRDTHTPKNLDKTGAKVDLSR
jgi:hypothetical protein